MAIALTVIVFFIGASLASFVCAMLSRKSFSSQFSTQKRSRCDDCRHVLDWYELIPVLGFFINRGKCRHCRNNIPAWYLFAEIFGGIASVIIFGSFTRL